MANPSDYVSPPAGPLPGGLLAPPTGMKLAATGGGDYWWAADPQQAPPPPPAPPAIPMEEIPDGPPDVAAVQLLARLKPGAAAELAPLLAAVREQVDDLVERARLGRVNVRDFIDSAARHVRLEGIRAARAATLAGTPTAPPAAAELAARVWALVASVRRYRDGAELHEERARRGAGAAAELVHTEWAIGRTVATVCDRHVPRDGNDVHHRAGLYRSQDVWLIRATEQLARRAAVRARLAALAWDPGATGAAVTAAVAAAGRDRVAAAIAGATPAVDAARPHRARIEAIAGELAGVDPETRRAAGLKAEAGRLEQAIRDAEAAAEAGRLAAAAGLLSRAGSGDPAAIGGLMAAVRGPFPALAEALAGTRAGDDPIGQVVAELVAEALERCDAGR